MKIYEKLLNSTKYKKTINKLEYYWYYFQDFIFYLYSLLLTVNKRANVKIITASDYKFYDSLIQLIDSIIIHEPNTNIVVYDIGLMTSHIEELKKTNRVELKTFDFEKYPKFLSERDKFGKLGAYAWKSAILNEVLEHENKDIVLWLDAGNILTSSLKRLKKVVLLNNFYSPLSAGNLIDWCHPKTLQYLNAPKYIFKKANLTGGLVAFNTASSFAKDLAKKWYKNSMIEDCIAPPDSDRNNHRQDQSVLSILFYFSITYLILSLLLCIFLMFFLKEDINTWFATITGSLLYAPFLSNLDLVQAAAIGIGMHYSQYITLQIILYFRKSIASNHTQRAFNLFDSITNNKSIFVFYILFYTILMSLLIYLGSDVDVNENIFGNYNILYLIPFLFHNLHFYADMFMWKFSNSHIKKTIGSYLFKD